MKKTIIALLLIILLLSFGACGCSHEWIDATCTSPKTCSLCGLEEGEVIAHNWKNATCTEPKTCISCKATEGLPIGHSYVNATCDTAEICSVCAHEKAPALGHSIEKTEVTKKASCTEIGIQEGLCNVCEQVISEEIPLLPHTPGKQTVAIEATYDTSGTKVTKCSVCDFTIEEIEYELDESEKEIWFKKNCEKLSYDEITRFPDEYEKRRITITGEISYIIDEPNNEKEYSIYRVETKKKHGYYYGQTYYVFVDNYGEDFRLIEDDIVTFYGELDGLYDDSNEGPKLFAIYYDVK